MPRKCDIANGGSVAVDSYQPEGEGDLGHPRAPPLDQQVNEEQAEDGEQGQDGPVLRAAKTRRQSLRKAPPADFW